MSLVSAPASGVVSVGGTAYDATNVSGVYQDGQLIGWTRGATPMNVTGNNTAQQLASPGMQSIATGLSAGTGLSTSAAGPNTTTTYAAIQARTAAAAPPGAAPAPPSRYPATAAVNQQLLPAQLMAAAQQVTKAPAPTSNEIVTAGNGDRVHIFRTSGTFQLSVPTSVRYMLVGGGGGGGTTGGGGGGGVVMGSVTLQPGTYPVAVGRGGAGTTGDRGAPPASSGENSSFNNIVAIGGGAGGSAQNTPSRPGGSGGGGGSAYDTMGKPISQAGAPGAQGQGAAGGQGSSTLSGGGGGGAGGPGGGGVYSTALPAALGGTGGVGVASDITGASVEYGSGGGGRGGMKGGSVSGGGGPGGALATAQMSVLDYAFRYNVNGVANGTPGTGGGGGATGGPRRGDTAATVNQVTSYPSGAGGSGIVVIRVPASAAAVTSAPVPAPTPAPTDLPTGAPITQAPPVTRAPWTSPPPTQRPTFAPPTFAPTVAPTTMAPTFAPPTMAPTFAPTTMAPTFAPPTMAPTFAPPACPPLKENDIVVETSSGSTFVWQDGLLRPLPGLPAGTRENARFSRAQLDSCPRGPTMFTSPPVFSPPTSAPPSMSPTPSPTVAPTLLPTSAPVVSPTPGPTEAPTVPPVPVPSQLIRSPNVVTLIHAWSWLKLGRLFTLKISDGTTLAEENAINPVRIMSDGTVRTPDGVNALTTAECMGLGGKFTVDKWKFDTVQNSPLWFTLTSSACRKTLGFHMIGSNRVASLDAPPEMSSWFVVPIGRA